MWTSILSFLKNNALLFVVGAAVVFLWYDYVDNREKVAVLSSQVADQAKTIDGLCADIRLREIVQADRQEAQQVLGGQINAATRLLDQIKTTPWATSPYPDDVRGALRMLEQGRPDPRDVHLPAR